MNKNEQALKKQVAELKSKVKKLEEKSIIYKNALSFTDYSNDIYFYISAELKAVLYNKSAKRFFKEINNTNSIGQNINELFFHFHTPAEQIEAYIKVKKFDKPLLLQYKSDYYNLYAININDEIGIKLIKTTEQIALKKKEQLLTEIIKAIPQMFCKVKINKDGSNEFEYLSPQIEKLLGWTPDEYKKLSTETVLKNVHPDDMQTIMKASQNIRETKKPQKFIYRFRHHTKKKYIWIEEYLLPKFNKKGQQIAYFGLSKDITKQVKAERQLEKNEEEYKSLIDNSPVGTILINNKNKLLFANKSALDIFKFKDYSCAKGKNIFEIIPKNKRYKQVFQKNKAAINAGNDIPLQDIEVTDKQGKKIVIQFNASLVNYLGGKDYQITFQDVTTKKQIEESLAKLKISKETNKVLRKEIKERKRAEKKLTESRNYAKSIINSSLDMIITTDKNGRIIEYNDSAQKQFGYKKEEIVGENIMKLYAQPDFREIIVKSLQSKGVYAGEILNVRKDGVEFPAIISASNIYNAKGQIIGAMGVSRNVTEDRANRKKIKHQSARLKAIIESSLHVFWTYHPKEGITSFNSNFVKFMESLYNTQSKTQLGHLPEIKIDAKERQFWRKKYSLVLAGEKQHFHKKSITKAGLEVYYDVYLNPINEDNDKASEVSGIANEITKQKEAEQKLIQSLKEKDALLKEVHHRVKNNLQIISSIFNLQASYIKEPKMLALLSESQNRIRSMAFIHEILYQNENLAEIDFTQYIIVLSKNLIYSYDVSKEIDLKLHLAPIQLDFEIAISCGLIINELVTNSIKYAFPKGKKGIILIELKKLKKTKQLQLVISDDGIGIPNDIDYKNNNTLGLQLVTALVEQIDGNITLNSNKGANFVIKFDA